MELELNLNEQKNEVLGKEWYDDTFKQKLEEALQEEILSFDYIFKHTYTDENLDIIFNKYNELDGKTKYEYANKNTVSDCEKGKMYSIKSIDKDNCFAKLNEYDGITMKQKELYARVNDIPSNINSNMFLRKKGDKYVVDEVTTIELYEKMKDFFDDLNLKQKQHLENMRKEGNIYRIDYIEDDCETWCTTLINVDTNEKFQELDFPHDIFHDVGDYVKYENGHYSIAPKTGRYQEKPYAYEFCEREQCYYTRFGKIDDEIMDRNDGKLEKMFIRAKQAGNGKRNFITDIKIKAQVFLNKILSKH